MSKLLSGVREELGLVLRGQRQLLGLVFQVLPRQLDFAVLALHLFVLVGQQPRLLLQLFVRLLQLLASRGELDRQRL
jgi:hypothetical protein